MNVEDELEGPFNVFNINIHAYSCPIGKAFVFITAALVDTMRQVELYIRWGSDNGHRG